MFLLYHGLSREDAVHNAVYLQYLQNQLRSHNHTHALCHCLFHHAKTTTETNRRDRVVFQGLGITSCQTPVTLWIGTPRTYISKCETCVHDITIWYPSDKCALVRCQTDVRQLGASQIHAWYTCALKSGTILMCQNPYRDVRTHRSLGSSASSHSFYKYATQRGCMYIQKNMCYPDWDRDGNAQSYTHTPTQTWRVSESNCENQRMVGRPARPPDLE